MPFSTLPIFLFSLVLLSSISAQRTCPCRCVSSNLSSTLSKVTAQCNRPIFAAIKCAVSSCTLSNLRMTPGLHCCAPSPSPSPTPLPSPAASPPALCPCICRPKGIRRTERAQRECRKARYFPLCKVAACVRGNGKEGVACCHRDEDEVMESPQPMQTPEVMKCPCLCRPGFMAMKRAEKECMGLEGVCETGNCVRRSGAMGAQCCDQVME